MADKDLNRLKLERTQLRRHFTNDYKKLMDLVSGEQMSVSEINIQFNKFSDKAERLFTLENSINDILFTTVSDEIELAQEYDLAESYREKWVHACSKHQELFSAALPAGPPAESVSNSSLRSNKRTYKLPKIDIEKFDGDLKNWISFWAQFRKIHEDESLDVEDKFQYLRQATLKGSPARELVDSFPASAANYPKVIEQLKSRFGRDGLLIILYVRELLKLVLTRVSGNKPMLLRTLYDKLVTQIRALESLNVTSEKYACLLFPLVESALSENVLKDWERARIALEKDKVDDNLMLERLLNFLRHEVESEERMRLARDTFANEDINVFKENRDKKTAIKDKIPTAAGLANLRNNDKKTCIFCEGSHQSPECFKVQDKNADELKAVLKEKGGCFSCLKKRHGQAHCRANLSCIICKGKHVPLMCPERKINRGENNELSLVNNCNFSTVLMQTLAVKIRGHHTETARVLIDTGSQRSYISKRLVAQMKYEPLRQVHMVHALFGGVQTDPKTHLSYRIRVSSLDDSFLCNFEALDTDDICQAVPRASGGTWTNELEKMGIHLSDASEGPIDILIGADIAGKIITGQKITLKNGLVALETTLGWTVMGKVASSMANDFININLLSHEFQVSDLWKLEVIGIEDPTLSISKKEEWRLVERQFRESVRMSEEGRYEVSLPWVGDHPKLPSNFLLARRRLETTVKKLETLQLKNEYGQVFTDWMREGIIEEVPFHDCDRGHYLPHRAVIKEGSSTPLRPVFDASAKEKGRCSLNDCLEKGINLIELIPNILLRFRLEQVGVSADIRKAFLQISIQSEHRDFLRFLWIGNGDELRIFRHRRVVFGVTCSPFQLMAVINFHLDRIKENLKAGTQSFSLDTVEKLRTSFYVDNCVTSLPSFQEAHQFQSEAVAIFEEGMFDLRQWEFTGSVTPSSTVSVLGLLWDKQRDILKINQVSISNDEFQSLKIITRRKLLSLAQRVYDPLGFSSPIALIPKLLLQRSWNLKGNWDSELPGEIQNSFQAWLKGISVLNEVEIPRWIHGEKNTTKSVHIFCDASQHAYATAIFMRSECSETVYVNLIQARSRVAPIKRTTIPRLELLAATIGSRLAANILDELGTVERFYWTDSSTVLAWIQNEGPWGVFVDNRVREIRQLTGRSNWNHLPGNVNPADLPSRGCSPQQFLLSRWWEGPQWMKDPITSWPKSPVTYDEEEINTEKRKTPVVVMLDGVDDSDWYYKYFSSYTKIVRMIAWILRFSNNSRHLNRNSGELTVEEVEAAEALMLLIVQKRSFPPGKSKLKLQLFKDSHGLTRVRTQIVNREDNEDFRFPILLSSHHPVVLRLIEEFHRKNSHAGGQTLVCLLRERYWIIKCRKTVRSVTSKCVVCRRQESKRLESLPSVLPPNRVRDAAAFEVVGIDYAGPLILKEGEKAWICLFTCAVYRAVHLELVTSLSTECFLQALRRFIARRGRPSVIYTDNGLNFRGASNALGKLNWTNIEKYSMSQRIKWIFNPPSAAWWGGWWERMIGLLKRSLRKVLGKASLGYEELLTVLCDCEALVNSRPLTYVSERPEDLQPLTPGMFIQDMHQSGVPDCDRIDSKKLNKRLNYRQRVREDLRKRFRVEYLGLLKGDSRKRSQQSFKVGDVVLVEGEGKRLDWPLAKIIELLPGRDGETRLVRVKTAAGQLMRPVQRVYPLEVTSVADHNVSEVSNERSSRPGPGEFEEPFNSHSSLRRQLLRSGRQTRVPGRLLE